MQLLKYLLIGTAAVTEARQEPRSISCTFVRNDQRGNFITQCGTQDYFAGKGGDDALGAICTRTLDAQGKAITTCDSPEIICQEAESHLKCDKFTINLNRMTGEGDGHVLSTVKGRRSNFARVDVV